MTNKTSTLYYIHDPMCSWCWGFKPAWNAVQQQLPKDLEVVYLVGGLAADSDQPMATPMQHMLSQTWHRIEAEIPGIQFNHEFWNPAANTNPRRSTYPACRAVLAAKLQKPDSEKAMIEGIQRAYYLEAKNPSNTDTLIDVASSIGLDPKQFKKDLACQIIEEELQHNIKLARQLSNQGFPSLVLYKEGVAHPIQLDYNQSQPMVQAIEELLT